MIVLAIDTSSIYASCAVLKDDEIISERMQKNGLVHSEALLPMVEDCLNAVNLTVSEVDLFACVAGPGSFTGVRIGVCAVKGLATPADKMCVAVNTLDCLMYNLPYCGCVCPIMDARRGQVYCAVYENGHIIRDYDACGIDELAEALKGKRVVFLGDGVPVFKDKLASLLGENAVFAPPQLAYTRAASACYAALKCAPVSAAALDAIYLRKPQAEREYAQRHGL